MTFYNNVSAETNQKYSGHTKMMPNNIIFLSPDAALPDSLIWRTVAHSCAGSTGWDTLGHSLGRYWEGTGEP